MKELSLNILDIAENSLKAGAKLTEITISEEGSNRTLTIKDNGCGMTEETLKTVTDPFYTTRTTRKVGMGLPLLKLAAVQADGFLKIESRHIDAFPENPGTVVTAVFNKDHIDCIPVGDVTESMVTLIQGHPDRDFIFEHKSDRLNVRLDTRELRTVLEDVPLDSFEVLTWIREFLNEQYASQNNVN